MVILVLLVRNNIHKVYHSFLKKFNIDYTVTATDGVTNYENAFDGNNNTYATCGTDSDYIQLQYELPIYTETFTATCGFESGVSRACNMALYTYDTQNEFLIANGTGASQQETYTTSATFKPQYARTLRFKLINSTEGTAPTTDYPTRIKEINLQVNDEYKQRVSDITDGQDSVTTSYENRTGTWKKVMETITNPQPTVRELTHQNYYFVDNENWTQPVLTSNGQMDIDEFAVSAVNTDTRTQPYYAFDANKADAWNYGWLSKAKDNYLQWYNSQMLNIKQLEIQYQTTSSAAVGYISSWELKASNDNINYVSICTGTQGNYGITTIPIEQEYAYKYWRFCVIAWPIEWYAIINLQITAACKIGIYV